MQRHARKLKEKQEGKSKSEDEGNIEDPGAHICEYCDKKFKSEDSLFGHVTLKHPEKHEFLQYMLEVRKLFLKFTSYLHLTVIRRKSLISVMTGKRPVPVYNL